MEIAPDQPEEGQPCNGCGVCCKAIPCSVASYLLGVHGWGRCPALEYEDGRYWCGLLRRPSYYMGSPEKSWADPAIIEMLFATKGWIGICDSG